MTATQGLDMPRRLDAPDDHGRKVLFTEARTADTFTDAR